MQDLPQGLFSLKDIILSSCLKIYIDCLGSKPTTIPMDPKIHLTTFDGDLLPDHSWHHRLIGRLLYLTLSRPDITFAIHRLSQFVAQPQVPHYKQIIISFVISNLILVKACFLLLPLFMQLRAFSDANSWASYADSRKFVTSFCIFLGDLLVSWKAKKQSTIAHSSIEVGYQALATTTSELI